MLSLLLLNRKEAGCSGEAVLEELQEGNELFLEEIEEIEALEPEESDSPSHEDDEVTSSGDDL